MHNNKVMKASEYPKKEGIRQDSTSQNKMQDNHGRMIKDDALSKEGEWSRFYTSLER